MSCTWNPFRVVLSSPSFGHARIYTALAHHRNGMWTFLFFCFFLLRSIHALYSLTLIFGCRVFGKGQTKSLYLNETGVYFILVFHASRLCAISFAEHFYDLIFFPLDLWQTRRTRNVPISIQQTHESQPWDSWSWQHRKIQRLSNRRNENDLEQNKKSRFTRIHTIFRIHNCTARRCAAARGCTQCSRIAPPICVQLRNNAKLKNNYPRTAIEKFRVAVSVLFLLLLFVSVFFIHCVFYTTDVDLTPSTQSLQLKKRERKEKRCQQKVAAIPLSRSVCAAPQTVCWVECMQFKVVSRLQRAPIARAVIGSGQRVLEKKKINYFFASYFNFATIVIEIGNFSFKYIYVCIRKFIAIEWRCVAAMGSRAAAPPIRGTKRIEIGACWGWMKYWPFVLSICHARDYTCIAFSVNAQHGWLHIVSIGSSQFDMFNDRSFSFILLSGISTACKW